MNRHDRRAQVALSRRERHKLSTSHTKPTHAQFAVTEDCLRMSTALKRLRAAGNGVTADKIEQFARDTGSLVCKEHGDLPDPIIGLLGKQVVFACPECSGDDVRVRWIAEGVREGVEPVVRGEELERRLDELERS